MIYRLLITCEPRRDVICREHAPVIVETITAQKEGVSDKEIEMVVGAFAAQLDTLVTEMVR